MPFRFIIFVFLVPVAPMRLLLALFIPHPHEVPLRIGMISFPFCVDGIISHVKNYVFLIPVEIS